MSSFWHQSVCGGFIYPINRPMTSWVVKMANALCFLGLCNTILVVPRECRSCDDILRRGLWMVKLDQDITPAMETKTSVACWDRNGLLGDQEP
ncbi:hypothetical protein BDV29DRAFT_178322 [Aspergillus leporis]|uniref:Uncharacterized protein n=1 Tax=Aspergillus leporis TaxID=41062 RepID=A0A5N5WVX0_9EURO|nr:hypothetical protein BDV29DRAFT_178322 [Aspergillus leporis]